MLVKPAIIVFRWIFLEATRTISGEKRKFHCREKIEIDIMILPLDAMLQDIIDVGFQIVGDKGVCE